MKPRRDEMDNVDVLEEEKLTAEKAEYLRLANIKPNERTIEQKTRLKCLAGILNAADRDPFESPMKMSIDELKKSIDFEKIYKKDIKQYRLLRKIL